MVVLLALSGVEARVRLTSFRAQVSPPTSEDYPAPVVGSVKFKRLYFRPCIILNEFAQ